MNEYRFPIWYKETRMLASRICFL